MTDYENHLPRLSVILPVYNREKHIERAIVSILSQTFRDWELIIVDDGSTDSSGEICDRYAQNDNRIRVFHTSNHGVSHARNLGLDNSRGEWFAFLDSDDEYLPNAFESMLEYSDGVDIVIAATVCLPSYLVHGIRHPEPIKFAPQSSTWIAYFDNSIFDAVWGKLFKREKFNLRFNEDMRKSEDYLYMVEIVSKSDMISCIPIICLRYYLGSNISLFSSFFLSQLSWQRKSYEKVIECFPNEKIRTWAGTAFIKSCITFFGNLVYRDDIDSISRTIIIQTYYEKEVAPVVAGLKYDDLSSIKDELCKAILTGNPETIIKAFEKHSKELRSDGGISQQDLSETEVPFVGKFNVRLANITIEINHKYELIKEKCSAYIDESKREADIVVYSSDKRNNSAARWRLEYDGETIGNDYSEYDAVPYQFYGELSKFNAFWLHSVVIEKDGAAYAFTAQPGVGKSTHAGLWLKAFSDAHIINGDNPIIRLHPDDGKFYAYGTPFCGKEGYNENRGVPLKAVCFLQRGDKNEIHRIKSEFALARLMKDNFRISADNGEMHYNLYKKFINETGFYSLSCNMDIEAAKVAYDGMAHNR